MFIFCLPVEVGPSLPTNGMTLKMGSNGALVFPEAGVMDLTQEPNSALDLSDPSLPVKMETITVIAPLVAASNTKSITTNKTDEGLCTQDAIGEIQSSSQVVVITPAAQFETAPEEQQGIAASLAADIETPTDEQQAIAASLAAQFETAPEEQQGIAASLAADIKTPTDEQQAIAASLAAQFETAPEEQQGIAASLAADIETPTDEAIASVVQTLATLSTDEPPTKKIKIEGPDLQSEEEQGEGRKGKGTKKMKPKSTRKGTRKR